MVDYFEQRAEKTGSFEAQGTLRFTGPDGGYALRFNLLAARPGNFRITLIDFLGRTQLTMAADERTLSLLDHAQARLYQGPAIPENFRRLKDYLPLSLDLTDIIAVFSGNVPGAKGRTAELFEAGRGEWRLKLSSPAENIEQNIFLDSGNMRVNRIEFSDTGGSEAALTVEYSEYQAVNAGDTPFLIRMANNSEASVLSLRYRTFSFNPVLPEGAFKIAAPAQVEVLPWPD